MSEVRKTAILIAFHRIDLGKVIDLQCLADAECLEAYFSKVALSSGKGSLSFH